MKYILILIFFFPFLSFANYCFDPMEQAILFGNQQQGEDDSLQGQIRQKKRDLKSKEEEIKSKEDKEEKEINGKSDCGRVISTRCGIEKLRGKLWNSLDDDKVFPPEGGNRTDNDKRDITKKILEYMESKHKDEPKESWNDVNKDSCNPNDNLDYTGPVTSTSTGPSSVTSASATPATATPVTSNPATATPVTSNPATATPVTSNPATSNPVTSTSTDDTADSDSNDDGDTIIFMNPNELQAIDSLNISIQNLLNSFKNPNQTVATYLELGWNFLIPIAEATAVDPGFPNINTLKQCPAWENNNAIVTGDGEIEIDEFCDKYGREDDDSKVQECKDSLKSLDEKYEKIAKYRKELKKFRNQEDKLHIEIDELLEKLEDEEDDEETEASAGCIDCISDSRLETLKKYREMNKLTWGQKAGHIATLLGGLALGHYASREGRRSTKEANRLRAWQGEPALASNHSLAGIGVAYPFISQAVYGLTNGNRRNYVCTGGMNPYAGAYQNPYGRAYQGGFPGAYPGVFPGAGFGAGFGGGAHLGLGGLGGMPFGPGFGAGFGGGAHLGLGGLGGMPFGPGFGGRAHLSLGGLGGMPFGPGFGGGFGGSPFGGGFGGGAHLGLGGLGGMPFGPGFGAGAHLGIGNPYGGFGGNPYGGFGGNPYGGFGAGAHLGLGNPYGGFGGSPYGAGGPFNGGINPYAQYQAQVAAQRSQAYQAQLAQQQYQAQLAQQQLQIQMDAQKAWLEKQQSIQQERVRKQQVISGLTQEMYKIQQQINLVATTGVGGSSSILGASSGSVNAGFQLGTSGATAPSAGTLSTPNTNINTNPGDLPVIQAR